MNGIILLDKPSGFTSFDAVRAVSKVYSREKAGHSGTLDPEATGVLPIFLGRATKLISLLPDTDKSYLAHVKLGIRTDTGDADGEIVEESDVIPTEEELKTAAASFLGDIMQVPPMYSAKKQNGVPLYKLAREGKTAHREACPVTIYSIEISNYTGSEFDMEVSCSSGTYIRTLAEDIAQKCSGLCHLTSLRRTRACGADIGECISLDALRALQTTEELEKVLTSCESIFMHCPEAHLKDDLYRLFINGFRFPSKRAGIKDKTMYRIYHDDTFVALGQVDDEGNLTKLWQAET